MGKDGLCLSPNSQPNFQCNHDDNALRPEQTPAFQRDTVKKPDQSRRISQQWSKTAVCVCILTLTLTGFIPTTAEELMCPTFCTCSTSSDYILNKSVEWPSSPFLLPSVNCSNQRLNDFQEFVRILNNPESLENYTTSASSHVYHIHVLDMSNNRLTGVQLAGNIDDGANMSGLVIDSIDFSNNFISGFQVDDSCPFDLVWSVDLSFNLLESLDKLAWSPCPGLRFLREINVSHNAISDLGNSPFSSLVFLKSLDLSFNKLQTVSGFSFNELISLQSLFLNGNNLNRITGVFPYLPDLILLELSDNALENIPNKTFSNLSSLQKLDLTNNNFTYLDENMFAGLTTLVELSLNQNPLISLDMPVFQNLASLQRLSLSTMPRLSNISHRVFSGLSHVNYLNLSYNKQLRFLHPSALLTLSSLHVLDLSHSGFRQLSPTTFLNPNLVQVFLGGLPFTCVCNNAWLLRESANNKSVFVDINSSHCMEADNLTTDLATANFNCSEVYIRNTTSNIAVQLGSKLLLQCQRESAEAAILTWTTPSGQEFYHHDFHPGALAHLLSPEEVQPDAVFHKGHYWHRSSSYHAEINSRPDRIIILRDGSLYIDYMLRQDAGDYKCEVKNAQYNHSITVTIHLQYELSGRIKIFAYVVGFLCALGLFTLNVVCVIISWTARRLVNKRRRAIIHQMLESLNVYKSTQVTRIHENYLHQLSKVRNQYHIQRGRLHNNYTSQVVRVKRGCSNQVERVRENYNSKLNQLREYSSKQIMQIRESANNQIGRIRDYGSLQLDRLRETYKLQQQHVLKLLDTMNLDNCRSVVETECMRTESMMFDIDLEACDRVDSPMSPESDYDTAASSTHTSNNLSVDMDDDDLSEGEIYGQMRLDDEGSGDENSHQDGDDIQIEMNMSLSLAEGLHLDAKEVWTFTGDKDYESDHTLYTNVHGFGLESQGPAAREKHNKPKSQCSQSSSVNTARRKHDFPEPPPAPPLPLHTVTLDLDLPTTREQGAADQQSSPTGTDVETGSGNFVTPETSPVRLWSHRETLNESDVSLKDMWKTDVDGVANGTGQKESDV